MKKKKIRYSILFILILFLSFCVKDNSWKLFDINIKMRDGFVLKAFLLRPVSVRDKKYGGVVCFHQLWGNRDDYLKLLPDFKKKGIITLIPNLVRQRPNLRPERISDLRDSLNYFENLSYIDKSKIGVITASFSVETGLKAITNDENVKALVMISGQLADEHSRKWITLNSNLSVFVITSIFDSKPTDPAHHHLLFQEVLRRSLNPNSRGYFIKDKENPFSVYAHGTFAFDEKPETISMIANFFDEIFYKGKKIYSTKDNNIIDYPPKHLVEIKSIDGFPIYASLFKSTRKKRGPTIVIYPPVFRNREFYKNYALILSKKGVNVLLPDTKRTCREERTVHLCKKEINGIYNFLIKQEFVNKKKIFLFIPSFYFLAGKVLIEKEALKFKNVIFFETGMFNFKVNPTLIKRKSYNIHYLKRLNIKKIMRVLIER